MKVYLKISALIMTLLMLTAMFLTGCSEPKDYGREIFSIDSKNITGFKTAYMDDNGLVTVLFEKKYAAEGYMPYGRLYEAFQRGEYSGDEGFYVLTKDDEIHIEPADITVNKRETTLSFTVKDVEPSDIYCFVYYPPNSWLKCSVWKSRVEVAGQTAYYQSYDESKGCWSDIQSYDKYTVVS